MELKIKIKYIAVMLLLFAVLISINWYTNMDYVEIVVNEEKTRIDSKELIELDKTWDIDYKQRYIWSVTKKVKVTKSEIPFVFDEQLISESKPELLINKL